MNRIAAIVLLILGSTSLFATPSSWAADAPALSVTGVETWLKAYQAAWESRDADKAATLFSQDATYQENPYQAPFLGPKGVHDYWAGVTKDQRDVKFSSEVLAVAGSMGIAHWHAEFNLASSGAHAKLDGIFVLEFTKAGQVSKLREWWHYAEEAKAKP